MVDYNNRRTLILINAQYIDTQLLRLHATFAYHGYPG